MFFVFLVPRGEIVVSTIVFVRFKDDMYQKGFVTSKTYSKLVVRIYGGDVQIVHINDSAAIVPDVVPDSSALKVGTTVIATFDGFTWEAGNIAEIKHLEEKGNDIYRVRFIGGGDTWVFSVDKIRILMTRNPKGIYCFVLKINERWLNDIFASKITALSFLTANVCSVIA